MAGFSRTWKHRVQRRTAIGIAAGACISAAVIAAITMLPAGAPDAAARTLLTPWQCIGGCGAGGGGGSAADIKWIGQGVSGGLIDAEAVGSLTIGENFEYRQVRTRLSMKPTWSTGLGLTIPIVSKIGSLQPKTNLDDKTEQAAGIADIMLDFSKSLGPGGEYSAYLNLTLPTGRYDVKRGREQEQQYLPTTLQTGGGLFNAALGLGRTFDVEDGLWVLEGFFSYPFAVNFHGKNKFVNSGADQYAGVDARWELLTDEQKKRFEYYFKPYGENDLGAYVPPSFTAALYYGNRRQASFVHSYGVKVWVPFGVAWVPAASANSYDPAPDPNNKTWSVTLHYGLEFSKPAYPFYFSVNKIVVSRSSPNPDDPYDERSLARWHRPALSELLHSNWIFAAGIKATMF